jgi:hypothetical protein
MSDLIAPGSLVSMRTLRRFSHYNVGETIAVSYDAARDLHAKRLAEPLEWLVPPPRATPDDAAPVRQPAGIVKK